MYVIFLNNTSKNILPLVRWQYEGQDITQTNKWYLILSLFKSSRQTKFILSSYSEKIYHLCVNIYQINDIIKALRSLG